MIQNKTSFFTGAVCALSLLICSVSVNAQINQIEPSEDQFNLSIENNATVDSLENYINDLIRNNQLIEAHKWATIGLSRARDIGYRKGEFELSLLNAYQFLNRSFSDSTIFYSKHALELADSDKQKKQAMNSLANGYTKAGQSLIAIDIYEQVLALSDSLKNGKYSVGVLSNLATAYSKQGEMEKGLKYYYEALVRSEEMGNNEYVAIISNNVGEKFTDLENFDQAEYYLNRSKEISLKEKLRSNLVRVHLNLGNLYKQTERFDEAEESYNSAMEMNNQAGNTPGQIKVFYNLGMMYLAKEDYRQARSYLEQALDESRKIGLQMGIFYSVNGLGELEMAVGNLSASIERYEEAVRLSEEFDNQPQVLSAYTNLYDAYKEAGEREKALMWLERVNELQQEIRSGEKNRLSAEYETKFNLRQTEQENEIIRLQQEQQQSQLSQQRWIILIAFSGIAVLLIVGGVLVHSNRKRRNANQKLVESNERLKKLNAKVELQKEELERLNNIKTKLFAIIAHDLRGPLSSLQSLLYLLREHELSEEETNKLITSLEKNMLENTSMMDNLLGWAKSQMNGISVNTRTFDLRHSVDSVLEQFKLQAENKNIHFSIEVEENTNVFADYDLMKLVIRNLVANAIKFSHENSTIRISAKRKDDSIYTVSVEDNGIGIPEENRSKIFTAEHFTSHGTNREKGSGLGLNLCKEYVEKHGGTIWFETGEGTGTTFHFTIAAGHKEGELVKV